MKVENLGDLLSSVQGKNSVKDVEDLETVEVFSDVSPDDLTSPPPNIGRGRGRR